MDHDEPRSPPIRMLRLDPAVETYSSSDGNRSMTAQVPFLDFVIDGRSVRDWIADAGYGGTYITNLCRVWLPDVVGRHVAELADAAMSRDQVEILTCAVCGDRDCGAILADILIAARTVTWHNWQYTDSGTTEALSRMPAMVFDGQLYRATLAAAPDAVAGLPYDEEAHRPRRMLWPWQWGWRLP